MQNLSGRVRAGLIAGAVAAVFIAGASFTGWLFALCSVAGMIVIGGVAGYFAAQWDAKVRGQQEEALMAGAAAGLIAGLAGLVATLLMWTLQSLILDSMITADPEFVAESLRNVGVEAAELEFTAGVMWLVVLCCGGLGFVSMLLSTAAGAVIALFTLPDASKIVQAEASAQEEDAVNRL